MKRPAFGSAAKSATGEVVDHFVAYGRVTAVWSAVLVTFFAAIGVGVGIWLINKSGGQLTSLAKATAPSTCAQERVSTGRTSRLERKCTTEVAYAAEGQEHRTSVDTSAKSYASGDKLSVYYDAGSPGDPTATRIPGLAGWFVIGGSVLFTILVWVWVLITRKYKVAAAATGANHALGALGLRRW
jgi:hypothetical protein